MVELIRLKIVARSLGIAAIEIARGDLVLRAARQTQIDPQRLVNLMTQPSLGIRVAPDHRILAPLPTPPLGDGGDPGKPNATAIFAHAQLVLSQLQ